MCSCHLSDKTLGGAQLLVLKLSPGRFELEGSVHHASIGTLRPSLRRSQRLLGHLSRCLTAYSQYSAHNPILCYKTHRICALLLLMIIVPPAFATETLRTLPIFQVCFHCLQALNLVSRTTPSPVYSSPLLLLL